MRVVEYAFSYLKILNLHLVYPPPIHLHLVYPPPTHPPTARTTPSATQSIVVAYAACNDSLNPGSGRAETPNAASRAVSCK